MSQRFCARNQKYYISEINYFVHMNNEILRRITNWVFNDPLNDSAYHYLKQIAINMRHA